MVLSQFKQQRTHLLADTEAIHQSMEEFVTNLEKENDELYNKLIDYIKVKESKLDERIRRLEEQLDSGIMSASPSVHTIDKQQTNDINSNVDEFENEKISKLYKQGFSPAQITKVLKMDQGEVELVINMVKKKQSYNK